VHKKPLGPWLYALTLYTLVVLITDPLALLLAVVPVVLVAYALGTIPNTSRSVKYSVVLAVLIVLFNLLFVPKGSNILYHHILNLPIGTWVLSWDITLTLEALIYGIVMGARLILIIGLFAAVTSAIEPEDVFMYSGGKMPLIIAIGVRFIGLLEEDAARIVEAQRARGFLDSKRMDILRNTKNLMYPLLYRSLNRTDELSSVLQIRGYGTASQVKGQDASAGGYGEWRRPLWAILSTATLMVMLMPIINIGYMPPSAPITLPALDLMGIVYLAVIYVLIALVFLPPFHPSMSGLGNRR